MRTITIEKILGKIEEFDAEKQAKICDNFRNTDSFIYYMQDETSLEIENMKGWIKEEVKDFEIKNISICEDYGWNVAFSGYSKDNEKFLGYCLQYYNGNDEKLLIRTIIDCDFYIELSFRNHHSLFQQTDCHFPILTYGNNKKFNKRVNKIEKFILFMAEQYISDVLYKYKKAITESIEYYESNENLLEFFSANEFEFNAETLEVA